MAQFGIKTGIGGKINNNIQTTGLIGYWDPAYKKSYTDPNTITNNLANDDKAHSFLPDYPIWSGSLENTIPFVGLPDASWDIDGVTDYIQMSKINEFASGSLSVGVWVKPEAPPMFVGFIMSNQINNGFTIGVSQSGEFYTQRTSEQNTLIPGHNYSSATSAYFQKDLGNFGKWQYITFSYDVLESTHGTIYSYWNGVLKDTQAGVYTAKAGTDDMTIGFLNYSGLTGLRYKGNIGSIQIYDRALSAGDVLQNFNAQKNRFGY